MAENKAQKIDYILEQKLGFDKIRTYILNKCYTEYAKERVEKERFSTKREEIEHRLSLTDEMRVLTMFESSFPDSGYHDCIPFLKPLENQHSHISLLNLRQLRDSLETLGKIINFFTDKNKEKYPCLHKLSEPISNYPIITWQIDSILDRFGEVKDNASEELLRIRRQIRDKDAVISRRIQSILRNAQKENIVDSEATVSLRDGHVLIPVSAGNKKKIPGIIFDESASGKTAFIEPLEVVELNNQLRELHFAQQREILKILVDFTDFLRDYIPELLISFRYMGEIDFIKAKAQVAYRFKAGKPITSEANELIIRTGRHPLLEESLAKEKKAIVPLNLKLTKDKRILLISGPNAGGKSVCLKTTGLLQYMFQWGLACSCSETSEFRIFDRIFIDIGDNQSLENDLSTYSSHILNMKIVLEQASKDSLILIDEFGSGTEPTAGAAIAEEILTQIEQKGSYGIITTHYSNLKFYANQSNGVVNGAMLFDTQQIQPLFKLEIGLPGNSFAFELARKIGLPERIIAGAEQRAGSGFVDIERNLKKIAKNKRALDEKLQRIKSTDRTLEHITEKYEKELTDIKAVRKSIIEEAQLQAKEILAQANRKIEATIKEIRESQAEKERTKVVRKELDTFNKELEEKLKNETDQKIEKKMEQILERKKRREERKAKREKDQANENKELPKADIAPKQELIKVGSKVRIKSNGLVGEVVSVSTKSYSVAVGNIISKLPLDMIEGISTKQYKDATRPSTSYSTNTTKSSASSTAAFSNHKLEFKPSIDLRGFRLEEAIEAVMHFIDDAQMLGMRKVSILHGKGNGVLREEIRKYLKITSGVKSFADEQIQFGGSGITVVEFDN